MPSVDNNAHTLLQGLSDFWIRFYKDTEELQALYRGTEVLLAQTYLDMLSSFLNLSVIETPLFNTELFKLITVREDHVTFQQATNPADDRNCVALPDNVVSAPILQNKVVDPTASLETDAGYEIDTEELEFRFVRDPSGQPGTVLATVTEGHLQAYGIAANMRQFYVLDGAPFAKAKPGYWLAIQNSGAANNATFRIARVLDDQNILIQESTAAPLTTPDPNSGSLIGVLQDSGFSTPEGFGRRSLTVAVGGSFDDAAERALTEIGSWYPESPVGLGVRKGDTLRVMDSEAVSDVPTDFTIAVVRHDKLYLSTDTVVQKDASSITEYAILREGPDADVLGEELGFAKVIGVAKAGVAGTPAFDPVSNAYTLDDPAAVFTATDRQRFIELSNCGPITWTATLSTDGTLTNAVASPTHSPLARAVVGCQVTISGSGAGNDGTYRVRSISTDLNTCVLAGTFNEEPVLSTVNVLLVGITNDGVYRVRNVPGAPGTTVTLSLPISTPDTNSPWIVWEVHDGYRCTLAHTRIVRESLELYGALGSGVTGGARRPVENTDFSVNYETGELLQVGYHAGTWGVAATLQFNYSWMLEVFVPAGAVTSGTLSSTDTTLMVNEMSAWAPDAQVDRFNLYNNYGHLINRLEASSETYREFIRGVFQLYILGPTLERLESALNVIAGFPVIRDDGEVLVDFDSSDPDYYFVTTRRLDGTTVTYQYPNTLAMRADIQLAVNYEVLTFESFEALTLAFQVSDYVQDPSWWTDIIVPKELMPTESLHRRRTVGALIENVVGAWDDPRIGDPGLFVGADDEGNVPGFIATSPAKRRKMANVVMDTFLKWNVFFVRFADTVTNVLSQAFIDDLVDLVLVAKPGYRLMFIEPRNSFLDIMLLEEDMTIHGTVALADAMVTGAETLTVQSMTWQIADTWAPAAAVFGQALVVADGITVPNGGAVIALGVPNIISKMINGPGAVQEDIDYTIDYDAGRLTAQTVWPAGAYTIDFRNVVMNPVGGMPLCIGGLDPKKVRSRQELFRRGTVYGATQPYRLYDPEATFDSALHPGQYVKVHNGGIAGLHKIVDVVDTHTVILHPDTLVASLGAADVTGLTWGFVSEEPSDGRIYFSGGLVYFESASALFRMDAAGRYIRVVGAVNASNNKRHKIVQVVTMARVVLEGTTTMGPTDPMPESSLHWRAEGAEAHMDLVERPLFIQVT